MQLKQVNNIIVVLFSGVLMMCIPPCVMSASTISKLHVTMAV